MGLSRIVQVAQGVESMDGLQKCRGVFAQALPVCRLGPWAFLVLLLSALLVISTFVMPFRSRRLA